MSNDKQERIVSQGVNFIIRNFDECHEDQDNGFSFHVPFILSTDEQSVILARESIKSEIDHGANIELIREDLGFITNKNRYVDPKEAMGIAIKAEQVGGILWKKVEARMLNDCGFIGRSKVKSKTIDETIKNYLEFPLMPEDLY